MSYTEFPKWQDVVKGRHLIFDTDAIVSLLAFDAGDIFEELKKLGVTFNYTNSVLLELMATDSSKEKLARSDILNNYNFTELAMTVTEIENARRIQKSWPIGVKGKPSVADLYIGGALAHYSHALLLTSNIKDFPMPIYVRKGFILLINQTDFKAICILEIDMNQVVDR